MPDKLVEFINETYTYAEISAGIPIVTNAVEETAVVKDVQIVGNNEDSKYSCTLQVAGIDILGSLLPTNGYSTVTGSAIVAESQAMGLIAVDVATEILNRFNYFEATASYQSVPLPTSIFPLTDVYSFTDTKTTVAVTPPFTVIPKEIFIMPNGDIYYTAWLSATMYKKTGGYDGVSTVHAMAGGAGRTYDGERYIYGFSSSTVLVVYDTFDDTSTTVTLNMAIPNYLNAYVCSDYKDGYLYVLPSYVRNYCFVNVTTGVVQNTGYSIATQTSGLYPPRIYKNPDGDYITLEQSPSTPYFYWTNWGADLSAVYIKDSSSFPAVSVTPVIQNGTNQCTVAIPDTPNILYITNRYIHVFDMDEKTIKVYTSSFNYPSSGPLVLDPDVARFAGDLLNLYGSITVRATGVKTTT